MNAVTAPEAPASVRVDAKDSPADTVIEFKNVTKRFKQLVAVNDVSLTIRRGEFVALLGPNGAGKTTLVEMIEGLKTPDGGSIRVLGRCWRDSERYLRGRLSGVLQEPLFIRKLRVDETIQLFGSFYGCSRQRGEEVLDLVDLTAKRKAMVETLSGGQRQRLALAVAVLNRPEIMVLDEPTTGLDPQARRATWDILRRLNEQYGATMILTTHYMQEAEFLCDRICVMHAGRILTDGSLAELLRKHGGGEVVEYRVTHGEALIEAADLPGILHRQVDARTARVRLLVDDASAFMPRLYQLVGAGRLAIDEIVVRKKTLDDLFMALSGRSFNE